MTKEKMLFYSVSSILFLFAVAVAFAYAQKDHRIFISSIIIAFLSFLFFEKQKYEKIKKIAFAGQAIVALTVLGGILFLFLFCFPA